MTFNAYIAYTVGMSKIQYTLRGVPPQLDRVLKKRAKQSGKSFNKMVIETLNLQAFGSSKVPEANVFNELFGANTLDKDFDDAIKDQSRIDEKLWQ